MTTNDQLLTGLLNKLIKVSGNFIFSGVRSQTLRCELRPYEIDKITGFTYNEKGAHYTGASHLLRQDPDWTRSMFMVNDTISRSAEYLEASSFVQINYTVTNRESLFEQYAFGLYRCLFENLLNPETGAVETLNETFLNELNRLPHKATAVVYLNGVILTANSIQVNKQTLIRQTTASDLERPKGYFNTGVFLPVPSAIIEIVALLTHTEHHKLQEQVAILVKLLSLYRLGSVYYNSYTVAYQTITSPGMEAGGNQNNRHPWQKYPITKAETKTLIYFLRSLLKKNDSLNAKKPVNPISIAFDRYSEAVLGNISTERRITNAMMSAEALLSDSPAELKFKLCIRAAKLLSFFIKDPAKIKADFAHAYDIRSKFSHGGHLSAEDKAKLQTKFGGSEKFTSTIVNYLRILIVIYLSVDIKKEALIKLIDGSLIEKETVKTLRIQLLPAKRYIVGVEI